MNFPVLFVSHGSPVTAVEVDGYNRALEAFAARIPKPDAIVAVSAHWEAQGPVRVTASEAPRTIHDFGGFPEELYRILYPAPGAPALAERIVRLLSQGGVPALPDPARGLDHGVWTPLLYLYPKADVPVVAVSLPVPRTPDFLLRLGALLAPLRRENVLLYGSGGLVHNLGLVKFAAKYAPVDGWAEQFDRWTAAKIDALDVDALSKWPDYGPAARMSVPTTEHFDPVFPVLGARLGGDRAVTLHEGFHYGNLSMRCFALES